MADDEDDWELKYPPHIVRWLVQKKRATGMNYYEILAVESAHPGLLDDAETYEWQELLIPKQMSGTGNG